MSGLLAALDSHFLIIDKTYWANYR